MNQVSNYFALLGRPTEFAIDMKQLDQAYRALQSQVHPDRFAHATEAERRVAMQRATQANEAYRVLKHPLKRAIHLLALRGVEVQAEGHSAMDPDFLGRQLEWREAVEDARAARNAEELDTLLETLNEEKGRRFSHLEHLLAGHADQPAAEAARQLMFIEKLEQEIGDSLEALDAP
jgi:molecular chaperone HscB